MAFCCRLAFFDFGCGGVAITRRIASSNETPCNLKSLGVFGMAELSQWHLLVTLFMLKDFEDFIFR